MDLFHIQEKIKEFTNDRNMNSDVSIRMIDLASEIGELSKELLKGSNYGSNDFEKTDEWLNEIGDVLFSLICIANETDTDLEESLKSVIDKYEKRFAHKGDIGSGR